AWNLAFAASLTALIMAHGVAFPPTLDSPAVVIGQPAWPQKLLLALTLLLSPVLYLDAGLFMRKLRTAASAPLRLIPGFLAGGLALILLVFANIFTNVWGYVKPISPFFRGKYWLPFLVASLLVALIAWATGRGAKEAETTEKERLHPAWALIFAAACLGTALWSLPPVTPVAREGGDSFRVMTFNTQQFNDKTGEKSIDRQLALIREASPDLLALQESDSTRISLNNNDYVRYLAEKLGYHSYFGPKTVAGSYGTALLSKHPLENPRSVYVYSDKDETGIAEAEIVVAGRRVWIYNVHPDSSDPSMLVFAKTLLERSRDKPYAVALGDFNLRDYEEAYKLIDGERVNAWTSVYPSEISADGVDMSGDDRIDHIFVSKSLGVRDPRYIKPPESATDHAIHWTDLYFAGL
ncbi:MAG: endonuclease/exonuclease/phosphatase family protein, partial [Spirochaetaceae bacterium]|nr:endonuclease/exonuclease/phosphatase family protein [Spirochaetaceae bacterium]